MRRLERMIGYLTLFSIGLLVNCSDVGREDPNPNPDPDPDPDPGTTEFYFGADLSYVNQILDHNGEFLENDQTAEPYQLFADKGTNIARFRLWHNPTWTQEIYGDDGTQLYNDLLDVERGIQAAKNAGLEILLDFHYSDNWADPGNQRVPAAWTEITDINVLADAVGDYTSETLTYLNSKGLMPEYVQIGNETNCGMLYGDAPAGFPAMNVCDGNWSNFATVANEAIQVVRDVDATTQIIFHVANPVNVDWWFGNIIENGVRNFDIIGFSYYPLWHTEIRINQLAQTVAGFKSDFGKEVMILETAYPWTTEWNDDYGNLFGGDDPISGYPYTPAGQLDMMTDITQALIDGGGMAVFYWEAAWITSDLQTQWGTGSAWENCAFFDFDGNANQAFDYMTQNYGLTEE